MCWRVEYVFLIIISTIVDYYSAIKIFKADSQKIKQRYLLLSLIINLGLLFTFKYLGLFTGILNNILNVTNTGIQLNVINLILPVGISFYTFQTLSYTIDVYRGKTKPEKHAGKFALYVSFFPQLVAGPIERSNNLLPQINSVYDFDYDRVTSGLKLMVWGFFKKIVIADRIAFIVSSVYANPDGYHGWPIILTLYLFFFQIYCDFSGYSDIAIGAARVFGIRLMINFNRPYAAESFKEFWRRWHISLTTWFRDYVYIPLGGSKKGVFRIYFNIFVVFVLSGLWHGASVTFLIWGAFLGLLQILENIIHKDFKHKSINSSGILRKTLNVTVIISLISFSTIFFGAGNVKTMTSLLKNMFLFDNTNTIGFISKLEFIVSCFFILIMIIIESYHAKHSITLKIKKLPVALRILIYISSLLVILLFGVFNQNDFIYFQF
ncbi:MAG: MBOAT family protein [Marinilabiliales bacterium]